MRHHEQQAPSPGRTVEGAERPEEFQSLEQRVQLLRDLLEALSEGVAVVGVDGRIRYANRAMREILGVTTVEIRSVFEAIAILFPLPEEAARLACRWAEIILGGQEDELASEIGHPDGGRRWVHFGISPLGEDGVLIRAVDTTRAREEQEARRELEEQLLQAQKMDAVGTLAGGVAHDMNNILGVIMGFASVLQQSEVGGATRVKCVDGILAAARRGRDLTGNLLGFARKGSFRKTLVQPNELVQEVRSLLDGTAPRGIRFELSLDPTLVEVEADASQLSQALLNLCLNAVEALGDRGTITITTSTLSLPGDSLESWVNIGPGRYAKIEVSDDGPGMDRQTLAKAFEPFFTTKPKGRGTGLGLSMVYGTVMHHGGDIQLRSSPGAGTRVTVLLPETRALKTAMASPSIPSPVEPAPRRLARVLLVDDEELMLQAGKVLLETLGHRVWLAQGGREAVQRFERHRNELDVVVLDLIMPDLDGAQTFRALRQIQPDVRILLCSGYPRERRVEALVAEGAAGFLRKPFELGRLAEELDRILGAGPEYPRSQASSGDRA